MPYGKVYEITVTPENTTQVIIVRIHDKNTYNPDPSYEEGIYPLNDERGRTPVGNVIISTIDNEEDKFTTIKASQAKVCFFSSNVNDLNTFLGGEDDRWIVKIWKGTVDAANLFWIGLLVTSELSEAYQPKPNIVVLTATDNIGLLKDTALTDFNSLAPKGKNKIIKYISWALSKTGLSLPIMAVNNLFEESAPGIPWYESCYLDAKTFEAEVGTREDCYTVLEKILKEDSFLFQWQAKWWIVRVDELDSNPAYAQWWDYDGTYNNTQPPINYFQQVGAGQPMDFIGESAVVSAELQYGSIKEEFDYEAPKEIIDNIDFSRGNWLSAISLGLLAAAYTVEDWTLEKLGGSPTISSYIKKIYQDTNWTYEKERYLVLSSGATALHWQKSNAVPVHLNDKLSFSVDRRLSVNQSGSGSVTENVAQLRLYGDDGTFWTCTSVAATGEPVGSWIQCTSAFDTNQRFVELIYDKGSVNEADEWLTATVETKPIPVDGDVYVLLFISSVFGTALETYFNNLQLDYTPFLNGSYSKYKGQYNKVSQHGNYKAKREETVFISDSPKKIFKGAIFKLSAGKYVLAGRFYAGNVFPGFTPPGTEFMHPFSHLQAYSVWNQYRRFTRIIDGQLKGIRTDATVENMPDLIHKYLLSDTSPHANNKYFMLLHKEQDFENNEIRGRLVEVDDPVIGKDFASPLEFKYITG